VNIIFFIDKNRHMVYGKHKTGFHEGILLNYLIFLRGGPNMLGYKFFSIKRLILTILIIILTTFTISAAFAQVAQQGTSTEQGTTVGQERQQEKTEAAAEQRRARTVETGGALLPAWRFVLEPSFEYDHFTSQSVSLSGYTIFQSILIGTAAAEKSKTDIYIPALTLRLGIPSYGWFHDSELNVKFPWLFTFNQIVTPRSGASSSSLVQETRSSNNFGDIEAYYYYHLLHEGEFKFYSWLPDIILRAGGHFPTGLDPYHLNRVFDADIGRIVPTNFPTGTGHWGWSLGTTLIKTVEPAVAFLNFAYYFNLGRQVGTIGEQNFGTVNLGNSAEWQAGLIFALQERLSMNFSYYQRVTFTSKADGIPITDSSLNVIAFKIGATYVFSPTFTLDVVASIGCTPDAPDMSILVRVPITFNLRSPFGRKSAKEVSKSIHLTSVDSLNQ
jgi:hypothetical protein